MPMVGLLVARGVNQDVGDVLSIPHLRVAGADLGQGVVAGAVGPGGIEPEDELAELRATEAGGQVEVLALDVMDHYRAAKAQEGRDHHAHALAAPWRR